MTEYNNEEDLFDKLINYSEEDSLLLAKPTGFTFLEPNIDITTNFSLKLPQQTNIKVAYLLAVVEQPQQCRMSGYGEKDRRPIDPAPIVKLVVLNCDQDDMVEDELESPFYVVHVSLWSEDMQIQLDLIEEPAPRSMRFLIGSLVSSPTLLKDLNDQKGHYFAFSDLSVRMAGQYRLHFSLIHLAM
ncbi:velvet factor-domain-containing protein [Helicostylum pulchrum]|nr:velvet factor-domain-containing protein [Helicostylum pulchrum]